MLKPVGAEQIEEIIYYYLESKHRWENGEHIKIENAIRDKARMLGFGLSTAWRAIRFARKIGMA